MQVRDFLFYWHLANYTKGFEVQADAWRQLQEHRGDETLDLAWLTPAQRGLLADETLRRLAREQYAQTRFMTRLDAAYPPRLEESFQPPNVLFYRGDWTVLNRICLAIVGARRAGKYTELALKRLGASMPPVTVVSGLAAGADTFAHEFALSRGWPTVAVIASGLDVAYPAASLTLQQTIARTGLVLSEYPLGVRPQPYRFVARNRIIAGLAHGVLVTEAASHSGSLITANLALQANREVFALPNRIDAPLGMGTNQLLQAGAKPVLSGDNIMEELRFYP
ncbi:DNA-processing protein DprA [Lacticaseibacillus sp. GG6-2]